MIVIDEAANIAAEAARVAAVLRLARAIAAPKLLPAITASELTIAIAASQLTVTPELTLALIAPELALAFVAAELTIVARQAAALAIVALPLATNARCLARKSVALPLLIRVAIEP
jgi:hypothetical protein